ncbi:MAG: TIGR00282 family metallophosphoesterase [Deltaproteobacteria bacterium CG11_big_fil_rev_8_21_14_0_20_47_16]|nr:MAG: TIGR00282 family metallophosphoesterase [Deltaproteobacteria bacterium CG11_big_fil_rev_8_21_14_0_20_47_16]
MRILCIGDIFGRPGRAILKSKLAGLREELDADFVIVNIENAAGGRGISPKLYDEFSQLPIDVMTSGNHIWEQRDINNYLSEKKNLLRPHNAPSDRPGKGFGVFPAKNGALVGVINVQGRAHMHEGDVHANPFTVVDQLVTDMHVSTPIIVVDIHAETTSEKKSMGWYLDGRVSCVYGTHTHVQTADEQVLPKGTAYLTDIGMTGPHDSVIGVRPQDGIKRFLSDGKEKNWEVADKGVAINGLILEVDEKTGHALSIRRLQIQE